MFEDYPTLHDAEKQAEEYATPLNELINPSDVVEDAEEWSDIPDERIRRECAESARIVATEHNEMKNLIQDAAFRYWTDGFKRVSESALAEDVPLVELIHVYNIWPNHVDKWEAYECAHKVFDELNYRIPNDCMSEARERVEAGLMEGSKPE